MLAIAVQLLTGRFVAQAYNSRIVSEWPPHPARLFSALAASHFAEEHPEPEERAVLEWLEAQGAPEIVASDASLREIVRVFVPVNDVALTDVDDEAKAVDIARAAVAQATAADDRRHLKKLRAALGTAERRLTGAIARQIEAPATAVNPRLGARVLPEYRGRQARTFPSVTPEPGPLQYVWPHAIISETQQTALDGLLRRVVRLGHSSSLVSMHIIDNPAESVLRPAADGELHSRGVQVGQLAALERAFAHHQETEPRVMPFVPVRYTRSRARISAPAPQSVFSADWIVLRRIEGPHLSMTSAAGVARAVRKTLMSFGQEPLPEMLTGHTADGRPAERPHLAIVPLPFVAHRHASGAILGVALVLPRDVEDHDRRQVYQAVAEWEAVHRQEDEETPRIPLNLGAAGVLHLERVAWTSSAATLTPGTWSRPSRVWHSATPVALDRNPGDLHSRNPSALAKAIEEAIEVVAQAAEHIGLPRAARIDILPAPPVVGAAKAGHYPPFPDNPSRIRRVLTHVRLEFQESVEGPILLGSGRYHGLGLFRPEIES